MNELPIGSKPRYKLEIDLSRLLKPPEGSISRRAFPSVRFSRAYQRQDH
jgi:hypothetical protein